MKRKKITYRSDCPISTALDIFGDKWSLLIIRDMLFKGKNTYGEFLKGGENIATNILADRLALLEAGGIISKTAHPGSKTKVLYKLTPKGIDLAPLMVEMIAWSEKYHQVHPEAIAFAKEIKKDKAAVLARFSTTPKT
ncbi:MAG TPA: helix-turn-helix domain-containing protein [Puia sp.]|uniref:winged helix-turn-helix transcriptional regulator n=1 Tax=Puia sp. TaxID=2045100 RepID=UPI002C1BFD71|nr:helix-turn-helix domain-containing protein [Puia sp.]HVU94306.1 helix-turn-helix domain-containing protein [Puia sp.]